MTGRFLNVAGEIHILIHTSVKLVTEDIGILLRANRILIHTSVKLVTSSHNVLMASKANFNPHEREARDI